MIGLVLTAGEIQAIFGLVSVLLSVAGSVAVAKLSSRANDRKTTAEADLGAGALALRIANRAERRISRLEAWRREVSEDWWPVHDARDRAIEAEVRKLDPQFSVPPAPKMPVFQPYTDPDDDK